MTGLLVRMLSVWDCASTVRPAMRAAIINTGTELLLGDVQDAHLAFIAREVLPNEYGSASGFYLKPNINPRIPSPHIFVLPGPPRELQPMFRTSVMPILHSIVPASALRERRVYRIAGVGESLVEEAIGRKVLAISGIELGYCARPGEVEVRIIGKADAIEQAGAIIRSTLGVSIFSTANENLEEVIVKLLIQRNETKSTAESCTGGLIANRITNVSGASTVFIAGYVCYANQAKIDMLNVDPQVIKEHGAVSEPVARALAEHARFRAGSNYALGTTGVAGPTGGSAEKPVGTVYVALASTESKTTAKKFFFPTDRETFKELTAQAGFEMLRRTLLQKSNSQTPISKETSTSILQ